jgi:hypothetical protein
MKTVNRKLAKKSLDLLNLYLKTKKWHCKAVFEAGKKLTCFESTIASRPGHKQLIMIPFIQLFDFMSIEH